MKVKLIFDDTDTYEMQKMKRMLQADNCFSLIYDIVNHSLDISDLRDDTEEILSEEQQELLKIALSRAVINRLEEYKIDLDLWS